MIECFHCWRSRPAIIIDYGVESYNGAVQIRSRLYARADNDSRRRTYGMSHNYHAVEDFQDLRNDSGDNWLYSLQTHGLHA